MVEIIPYVEPPDHIGRWMLRFTEAVPDAIATHPGNADFAELQQAKAYAEEKLFPGASGAHTPDPKGAFQQG